MENVRKDIINEQKAFNESNAILREGRNQINLILKGLKNINLKG